MSWGHDEYLYQVVKNYLPPEAGYIIRYHSFYPAHLHGAYDYLMSAHDKQMLPWLELFRSYDFIFEDGREARSQCSNALLRRTRGRILSIHDGLVVR
jgi:hypothetical protein